MCPAGLWASTDTGATWRIINHGMYNEYMPPERREDPIAQDIHLLSRCAARPKPFVRAFLIGPH